MATCCGQTNFSRHGGSASLSCRTLAFSWIQQEPRDARRYGRRTCGEVRSTIAAGIPLAIGSDRVTNPFQPDVRDDQLGHPGEALTLEQALGAYTRGSAISERRKRTRVRGTSASFADLAVLSQDIFKVPSSELPLTNSVLTIVGGRIVHEQN
jgi:predicted amidohydrolase YtcJ